MFSEITGSGPDNNQTTSDRTLADLEQIVSDNLPSESKFMAAGTALKQIRDGKLYKPRTWEQYVRERWGISRQYAHCLIQAAEFSSTVVDPPKTEREARKRVSEKRAKRKPEPQTASCPTCWQEMRQLPSSTPIEDLDADDEFEKFKSLAWQWKMDFSRDDYLRLLKKICEYTDATLVQ
jgi:hypothetical protein